MGGIFKSIARIFSPPKVAAPPPPPPPPSREDTAEVAQAARLERRRRAARGRSSDVLTSGLGLLEPAPVTRNVLLGE